MADKEIPDLTSGGAAAAGDVVHAFRTPNSRKATLGDASGKSVGTGSGDVAAGNHNHSGVYEPVNSAILKTDVGAQISGVTGKSTPVDADVLLIEDSAASNAKKSLTWANVKATLKTYFDTLYQPLNSILTAFVGLSPNNDDFLQRKAGAWANRTIAQVKSDLSLSGTNTGDQTSVSGNAGTATALATARSIYGNNFDGTAALNQVIASTYGGTGNGFAKLSGPATSEKTFTLPNASAKLHTDQAANVEKVTTITDGAGFVIDASLGNIFKIVAAADRTAGTTTNPTSGQKMILAFNASGGARTLTLPTATTGDFAFGSDIAGLTQTASGKTDVIGCIYDTIVANRWAVVAYSKGY